MKEIRKEVSAGMERPRIGKLSWPHAEMRIGNMRVQVSVHERATDDDGVDFWGTGKADGQAACVRWAERCRRFADELHALLEQYQDQDDGEWCQHCSPGADHCPVCGRGE